MAGTAASRSSPSLVDALFQRSLDEVIRSLRSISGSDPSSSVQLNRFVDEVRRELSSSDVDTRSIALSKLFYLSTIHFVNPSFAAFPSLQLLPSDSFSVKLSSYRVASLSLPLSPDLLLLSVNQLRKDLFSSTPPIASLALHYLSLADSLDIAREISTDFAALLNSKAKFRHKATSATLNLIIQSADSTTRDLLPRLVDNLNSDDQRLVSAAAGVFCELTMKDPGAYLPLAPDFHRILTSSKNNWVLIKMVKIFARLASIEPRLTRRIVDPVCNLMEGSNAKSLVMECVRAVAVGLPDFDRAVQMAVGKIREFLAADEDPNLRYLGLNLLALLAKSHPWAVEENREVVIKSLVDLDPNIRQEALKLVVWMVSESNLVEISNLLVGQAQKSDPEFCNEVLRSVLATCRRNVYEYVVDFDWYVSLLGEMARIPHCEEGEEIERQLVDISMRVKDARPELVSVARDLLIDPVLLGNPMLCRILCAAAWLSGEYVEFSRNPVELVEALLQPRISLLPTLVKAVYVQAVFKVLAFCFITCVQQLEAGKIPSLPSSNPLIHMEEKVGTTSNGPTVAEADSYESKNPFTQESVRYMVQLIEIGLGPLADCDEVEVVDRARNVIGLIQTLKDVGVESSDKELSVSDHKINQVVKILQDAFSEDLGPISTHAQERVFVPEGVVLVDNLTELDAVLSDEVPPTSFSFRGCRLREVTEEFAPLAESSSLLAEHRKRHSLYYLPVEKDEAGVTDYPCANEEKVSVHQADTAEDLSKLSDKSLVPKKAKHTKPRPVVIKLDEADAAPTFKPSTESKVDLLSGAVRDILLEHDGKNRQPQMRSSGSSSQKRPKEKLLDVESVSQSEEYLAAKGVLTRSSRTKSKDHLRHSERHTSPGKDEDEEEKSHRKSRGSHPHGKHKHKRRAEDPLNLSPQAPVVQDFLL